MRTIKIDGKKTARLQAPDVRKLEEAGMTLREIALRVEDDGARLALVRQADGLAATVMEYSPPIKEEKPQADEKAKK